MNNDKFEEQIDIVDKAFHTIWFNVVKPQLLSEQFRNLTFSDLHVITTAWKNPGKVLKEIREYMRLPQSTLSSIVSKLERLGLIKRAISYRDLRSYSLELTEEGKDILRQHEKADREQAREVLARLNEKERDEFTKLIQKIAAGY